MRVSFTNVAMLLAAAITTASCDRRSPDLSTGPFAISGVVMVTGRVTSTMGSPLDSVRIRASVPQGGQALYPQGVFVLSEGDGAFSLRFERSVLDPMLAPDTVTMLVRADPLKYVDRPAGVTPPSILRELRVTFGRPPAAPDTAVVNFVLPVQR